MVITQDIFLAYSRCPRKAFLLMFNKEMGVDNEHSKIDKMNQSANQDQFISKLSRLQSHTFFGDSSSLVQAKALLISTSLRFAGLEAECALLTKVRRKSLLGGHSYEPTCFLGKRSVNEEDKLQLYFIAYVLGQIQGRTPEKGTIVTMEHKEHTVKLASVQKKIFPALTTLRDWLDVPPEKCPALLLRRNCEVCRFHACCTAEAEKFGHISLLDGLTPKAIRKYEAKGIFSIKQLSYLFKPRKKRKPADRIKVSFRPELQALAIRTGKTYIQVLPSLVRQPVELFLDIEGVPDRNCYYLIGLLVKCGTALDYQAFWADSLEDEATIWQSFINKIKQYPEIPIFHYGAYERRSLETLGGRYGQLPMNIKHRLINLNAHLYGNIYFPARSNSLKVLGQLFGASWSSPNASGLQSVIWRHYWETTLDPKYRDMLTTYNREDCQALLILADRITSIQEHAASSYSIDFAYAPKQQATEQGARLHEELESLLKFAHNEYEKKRIVLRNEETNNGRVNKKRGPQKGHPPGIRTIPRASKTVRVPRRRRCKMHRGEVLRPTAEMASKTVIDLVFMKNGLRKSVTKYVGTRSYCRKCEHSFAPHGIERLRRRLFGRNFRAWVVYQRLCLRLPYSAIIRVVADQFNETVSQGTIVNFVREFAMYYQDTERMLLRRLLASPCLYVDETKINIEGEDHYVWVFTNGSHTIFRLTETRETSVVHQTLEGFKGVMVSDFFAAYDSVECIQQKCWSHLIRDLNDDLWKNPFDSQFESFVFAVKNLILPILRTVERFGQKSRFLKKFQKPVTRFYQEVVMKPHVSELAGRYQKRFHRYKDSLFTFLSLDGVGWNNNAAERALRHLAVQRKISGSFTESGARPFLLLLGIAQSCRFQGKSMLRFLSSSEKDLDEFGRKSPSRKRSSLVK